MKMNGPTASPQLAELPVPPKVEAAMRYLHFCQQIRTAESSAPFGQSSTNVGRELSPQERLVYDAALSTLLEYFNSDFDLTPKKNLDLPEPPPSGNNPVPVPVA